MRIAQIAPLYESVPPQGYGGTERVVSYLTEKLVELGHDVTLFASADSRTGARLVAGAPQALRLSRYHGDPFVPHLLMLEQAFARPDRFDVVHSHVDVLGLPLARRAGVPVVTTLHGRLDSEEMVPLYDEYADLPVVSISESQREPVPQARWVGTVHHGLPRDLYRFHPETGRYLAFIGRVSPEKRLDRAIEIAVRSRRTLKIAAKVDKADRVYFRKEIEPLLNHPLLEWIGEVDDQAKDDFLGGAAALLFPIDWPEPFGLTMIESMACGTPVIAWQHGSVAEVLEHGTTGFLCDDIGAAVRAVGRLDRLSRQVCREVFERRFTSDRMAQDYLTIYARLIAERAAARPARAGALVHRESAVAPAGEH
ncbi:MAG TPA: glycosyltransferase family 4 protein [Candidatus Polarisedimenticolia bacterium]|nr:glycosyltransferase family 4 protein [Candidatus Polarisedimenticolia bacterium]